VVLIELSFRTELDINTLHEHRWHSNKLEHALEMVLACQRIKGKKRKKLEGEKAIRKSCLCSDACC
jgi:hypothetical protein